MEGVVGGYLGRGTGSPTFAWLGPCHERMGQGAQVPTPCHMDPPGLGQSRIGRGEEQGNRRYVLGSDPQHVRSTSQE